MESTVVGWYGKLPLSREFLRRNAAGPEVHALDRWLQESILYAKGQLGSTWKHEYLQGDSWHFVFCPQGGTRLLVGTLTPSCDAVGREFPFLVFLRAEVSDLPGAPWLVPRHTWSFLRESRELLRKGFVGCDLDDVHARLHSLPTPTLLNFQETEQAYREFLRGQTGDTFWTDLLGEAQHPTKDRIVRGLQECLEPLKGSVSPSLRWGMKLPLLPSVQDEAYDLPFWIDLINRRLGRLHRPSLLLWNRCPTAVSPCLMVSLGAPSTTFVLFTTRPDFDRDGWFDLSSGGGETRVFSTPITDAQGDVLLAEHSLSLEEFLLKTGGARA